MKTNITEYNELNTEFKFDIILNVEDYIWQSHQDFILLY